MTAMLPVVEKPTPKPKPETPTEQEDEDAKKVIKVKVRKKDFTEVEIPGVTPILVKTTDTSWATSSRPSRRSQRTSRGSSTS